MSKLYIGADNGVSAGWGFIYGDVAYYYKVPTKQCLNYTKVKAFHSRIDYEELLRLLSQFSYDHGVLCSLERPMVNPTRFNATKSALRALEATLIALETLKIPYQYIDSKEWQKAMLPTGLKGDELKKASLEVGKRLFPQIDFKGFKDADGLLIAKYLSMKNG